MDGLAASFPLARKEAKKKLEARYSALKKKEKRSRKPSSSFSIASTVCGAGCAETISPVPSKEDHHLHLRQELISLKHQLRELRKNKVRSVQFADPLVVAVRYRPYTDPFDIPLLYFQEDELDLFEEDRHTVSGDIVECAFVETVRAVSVAYSRRANVDDE